MGRVKIADSVYDAITKSLLHPEMGGILGINDKGVITSFYYDQDGITEEKTYFPNTSILNDVIAKWYDIGIYFAGFVHSHPYNATTLSDVDFRYAMRIKEACGMNNILMLLYIPRTGQFFENII